MFVPGKPRSALTSWQVRHEWCTNKVLHSWIGFRPCPTFARLEKHASNKHSIKLERPNRDKHSILLGIFVNFDYKRFWSWSEASYIVPTRPIVCLLVCSDCLPAYLTACMSARPPAWLSHYLYVCMSVRLYVWTLLPSGTQIVSKLCARAVSPPEFLSWVEKIKLIQNGANPNTSVCLYICTSAHLYVCTSAHLYACNLYVCISVDLYVCVPIHLYVSMLFPSGT